MRISPFNGLFTLQFGVQDPVVELQKLTRLRGDNQVMVTLFRAARLACLPRPSADPLLCHAQSLSHNWTHYPRCPFQVGRYLCVPSSWSPSAVFNCQHVFCRFLVCRLKAVISFGSGGCCLSFFQFPVQGSSCKDYLCSYTVSERYIGSLY